jgi:hypothetical protein
VILLSFSKCEKRKKWMYCKTLSYLSCIVLSLLQGYCMFLFSRATVQLLSMWRKVCSFSQSWHRGDGSFFNRKVFLLCGNVSGKMLRSSLKACFERDSTVDHS